MQQRRAKILGRAEKERERERESIKCTRMGKIEDYEESE